MLEINEKKQHVFHLEDKEETVGEKGLDEADRSLNSLF